MKINSKLHLSMAAGLLLSLAACQNDDYDMLQGTAPADAVRINATIGNVASTRVNTLEDGTSWTIGDAIKVANTSANAINGKAIGIYTYGEDGAWTPSAAQYMVWADGENTFEAFYPYAEGTTNSFTEFKLPANQSGEAEGTHISLADWMTATATATKTADSKAIDLAFKHELVKITMNITRYNNQYDVASVQVGSPAFNVPTTLADIEGKTVNIANNSTTITPANGLNSETKVGAITAILPPGSYAAGDVVFSLTVNDEALSVKAGTNTHLTTGLEAGKAYTFNLTVGKNALTIGSVTVGDWGTGNWGGAGTGGTSDELPFQDESFVKALAAAPYNIPLTKGTIDPSQAETKSAIEAITELRVNNKGIKSLKGIEYFTNLTELECYENQLTTLDVSGLSSLRSLYCHENKLATLNVSGLSSLEGLYCTTNKLTTLDVSGLSKLIELWCDTNQLTTLDVSMLTKLIRLDCENNKLSTLDVSMLSKLIMLNCYNNQLSTLDVSMLSKLITLNCYSQTDAGGAAQQLMLTLTQTQAAASLGKHATVDYNFPFSDASFVSALTAAPYNIPHTNGIIDPTDPETKKAIEAVTSLDVSNKDIKSLKGIEHFVNLTRLSCYGNQLTTLDVSGLSSLTSLRCTTNKLSTLNVSGLSSLTELLCNSNQLATLDVSGLSNLTSLDCNSNQLSTLDVSGLSSLERLSCSGNQLSTLAVSALSSLTALSCTNNQLTTLNVSGLSSLTMLSCNSNQLSTLDVSGLSNLAMLSCYTNQLTTLNVSGLSSLETLSCYDNQLTTLNVSGLSSLTAFSCNNNQLSTLDVSGLSNLATLKCNNNQLATLNVSGLSSLTSLYCNNNQLATLNVSGLSSLTSLDCSGNALTTLDVSALSSLRYLYCYGQKDAGGAAQQLMLTLTQAQAAANLGKHATVDYEEVP